MNRRNRARQTDAELFRAKCRYGIAVACRNDASACGNLFAARWFALSAWYWRGYARAVQRTAAEPVSA